MYFYFNLNVCVCLFFYELGLVFLLVFYGQYLSSKLMSRMNQQQQAILSWAIPRHIANSGPMPEYSACSSCSISSICSVCPFC